MRTTKAPASSALIKSLLLWILPAAALIAAIGWAIEMRIVKQREATYSIASERVQALAVSYANQIHHTVTLLDQIALDLKYELEHRGEVKTLEVHRRYGAFPESDLLYITIVNESGNIITSSYASEVRPSYDDLEFFQTHKKNCCLSLYISPPEVGRRTGKYVIRFSRRVDNSQGGFAGVVFISIEPSYLTSFQYSSSNPEGSFVAVRLRRGPVLVNRAANEQTGISPFYRIAPAFENSKGVANETGERFVDNKSRLVAWQHLERYPLVALAGVTLESAYLPSHEFARTQRDFGAAASLLVVVLSGAGLYYSFQSLRQKRTEEEVREIYRVATDAAREGFYMLRPETDRSGTVSDFRIEDCNYRGAELFGLSRDKLLGYRLSRVKPKEYGDELIVLCIRALQTGLIEDEKRIVPPSILKAKWVFRRIVPSGGGLAVTIRDITAEKAHEEALNILANRDIITGLPNRHWLSSFLPEAVTRSARGNTHLAVMFIDLDNFKNVNDTLGHDAGDELLSLTANRLKSAVRASDHIIRLGGDEFTVILEHVDVLEDASRVAQKIIDAVREPYLLSAGNANNISASIGVSIYPSDGDDSETLLKHADIAMYAAKAAGKGCYQLYQSHLSDSLILRLSKEEALQQAVERDEFIVHYQPRVDAKTGEMKSMEALVRWVHPETGISYPTEFIDIAEQIGLIVAIGESVIEKVCAQIVDWRTKDIPLVPVSINVSPYQLKNGNVSTFLRQCLERDGIEPSLIELELTESAVIDKNTAVKRELIALRKLGIKLMIDDFGTSYSSLAQLHRLDIDVLKVDQAFTHALTTGDEGSLVFHAIVSMAAALKMDVVAEGVETREQLHSLQALACNEIQGHLISKAVAASEMTDLLQKRFLLSTADRQEPRAPAS